MKWWPRLYLQGSNGEGVQHDGHCLGLGRRVRSGPGLRQMLSVRPAALLVADTVPRCRGYGLGMMGLDRDGALGVS